MNSELEHTLRLGVIPEQGGSIANLRRVGQDVRFVEQYLKRYVREFADVYFFSYAREQLDCPVADNFHLRPNPGLHRWPYSFLMPILHGRHFRRCSVLRVLQATGALPARIARLLFGTPFVVTYGYHYAAEARRAGRRIRARLFDWRAGWALRSADGIIVTTPALAEFVRRFAPSERIAHIPNSVDTRRFSPASGTTERPPRPRLIAVGNLTAVKNHRLILEAVALAGRADLDVTIIGAGPEEQTLRRLAADKSIALELPGIVPNERLPERLRRSTVYLIPSLSEGQPKSLLEAMGVGLPCIGTNVKGICDVVVDGQTGWLCEPQPAALAAAISRVLSNEDESRAVGSNARRFVLENYDADAIMAREIAFLKSVARMRK